MKNKNKIILSILGLLIFSGVSNSTTRVVKANDSSPVINSSEVVNSNSTSTMGITTSSTNETTLTEEQLEDIVLKISNKILGEELTDKLFGMFGIGIIAIVLIYVVFQAYERLKNRKVGETLINSSNETFEILKEKVDQYKNLVEELKNENIKLVKDNNETVKEITKLTEKIHEDYKTIIDSLNEYSKIDNKINAILKIEGELMKKPSNITNGISSKVYGIIEEVNLDEKD